MIVQPMDYNLWTLDSCRAILLVLESLAVVAGVKLGPSGELAPPSRRRDLGRTITFPLAFLST